MTLTVPARHEGLLVAQLTVSPLDNERYLANNTASLAVDVKRERARVLLLADRPGWDVRFLAQAAAAESRLGLTVVYPGAGRHGPCGQPDGLDAARGSGRPWQAWDAFVVTGWRDVYGGLDWPGLVAAVQAGPGPAGAAGGRDRPARHARAGRPRRWPRRCRWPRTGPGPGKRAPGRWRPSAATGIPCWRAWPRASPSGRRCRTWCRCGPDPGALTLLGARPRRSAPDSTAVPLLVAGRTGQGRVVWYGGRRLWELAFAELASERGRTVPGEGAGRRLLRNLLVWVAAGDQESGLVFAGRQTVHPEGEPIRLDARWRDIRGAPVTGRAASVLVRRADADSAAVPARTYALGAGADGRTVGRWCRPSRRAATKPCCKARGTRR